MRGGVTASRGTSHLAALEREVVSCVRCPRLVAWRERVASEKRASFHDESYWGRPVPGFGDPEAWLLRTGRMFTGDRSGEWLYRALHRAGLCSRAESRARNDGLMLQGTYVTAAVRCAPPANKPTPAERDACRSFLERELEILQDVRVVVPLGGFAYSHVLRVLRERGDEVPRPVPRFGHGREVVVGTRGDGDADGGSRLHLVASFHPSQQNTFTGKLTEEMFDAVWRRAKELGGP